MQHNIHAKHWRLLAMLCLTLLGGAHALTALGAAGSNIFLPLVQGGAGSAAPPSPDARWSDPKTWQSGRVPVAGEQVTIPAGKNVLLDVSPPRLKSLMISGSLVFDQQDLALDAGWIMLHDGALSIGSEAKPFANRATITLFGSDPNESVMSMGTRGILLMGKSRLDIFGSAPAVAWTQLSDHAAAGATQLTLNETTTWKAGDQLVIAPTDFYSVGATEQRDVASASSSTVGLRAGLQLSRWGKLQYIGAAGMTLTPTTSVTMLTLDERAEVGNLTRNVVIQGADDALWSGQGFGAHIMAMEGSTIHINGAELRRVGQRGLTGRYPVHFHGLSYRADGTILADTSGQFVRNASIWNSQNRCIVLHGTNGVQITNNICYNIVGHAIFLEDGVERHNMFDHNLVLRVRNPQAGKELLKHEGDVFSGGSSGFWLTNPDNVMRNNAVADAQGNGIWYALPKQPLGLFHSAKIFAPIHTKFGSFENNSTHSNHVIGLQLDWAPTDDTGEISPLSYRPTADGKDPGDVAFEASLPFSISRLTSYKNDGTGLWHRQGGGTLDRAVVADNPSTAFQGSANCKIIGSASVGNSLNRATPIDPSNPPIGMASYHSSCDVANHLFINLPFVPGKLSGALNTGDYYIRPVDKGLFRDTNLRLIGSDFGYRMPPVTSENWTLAGALWDPYGNVGPSGNYWVYDDPFLTDGTVCQDVAPAGKTGKSCKGPYYGVQGFQLDDGNPPWGAMMPIEVTRDNGAVWAVGDGNAAPKLGNMRHVALVKGGSFTLRFPQSTVPRTLVFRVENMLAADDWAMLAVPFDGGATNPLVYITSWPNAYDVRSWSNINTSDMVRVMSSAASIADVRAANGDRYYQDRANNLIYIKLRSGLRPNSTPVPGSDDDLYRSLGVVVVAR